MEGEERALADALARPWTGKCIGKRTLFAFHLFLICLSVHILFVVVGAIVVFAVK